MESFAFCQQCGVNQAVELGCGHDHDHKPFCSTCGVTLDVSPLDVFITYSRTDAGFVRRLSAKLGGAGIPHWLDEKNLGPGDDFKRGISAALNQTKLLVAVLTPESVMSPWVESELVHAKKAGLRILPIRLKRFPLPEDVSLLLGSTLYADVFDRPDEVALDDICRYVHDNLCKIAAAGKRVVPVVEPAPDKVALLGVRRDIRYLGPVPYESEQRELFVGRDDYAWSILQTLQDKNKNVALYSHSGAGKTSLISAKIRTRLEEAGWEVWVGGGMRREPPQQLLGSISNRISFLVNWGLVRHEYPDPTRGVADQLRVMPRYRSSGKRVLILDQFEDVFTHHKDRDEDRVGFFADLLNALKCDPALRLLVAFRQEFLASFLELIEGSEELFSRVHLKRMDEKEACEAITRPVASYARFAPGVAEGIVRLLRLRPDGGLAEYIELVHLQIVCKELWRNLEEGITEIQQDHVDRAAGGGGMLRRFVENVLQNFVHNAVVDVAAETRVASELIHFGLLKFVNKSGGRVTLPMDFPRDRTGRLRRDVVEHLAARHLLRAETRGDEHWYELSHDLLVEPVAQHRSPKLNKLLAVTDLLATLLDRAREECEAADRARTECGAGDRAREECEAVDRGRGEGAARRDVQLTGYFGAHRDLLDECEGVYDPQLLDAEDEAELVFRASRRAGGTSTCGRPAWERRFQRSVTACWTMP